MNQEWLCDNWKDYTTTKLFFFLNHWLCLAWEYGHLHEWGFSVFMELRSWMRIPKRSSARKWNWIYKRATSLNTLLCNMRSLLMKTWWNWRPRERMKKDRGRGSNWRTEESHDTRNDKGIFFIWEDTVTFWGTGPEYRMAHKGHSSCSECNLVLPCRLW